MAIWPYIWWRSNFERSDLHIALHHCIVQGAYLKCKILNNSNMGPRGKQHLSLLKVTAVVFKDELWNLCSKVYENFCQQRFKNINQIEIKEEIRGYPHFSLWTIEFNNQRQGKGKHLFQNIQQHRKKEWQSCNFTNSKILKNERIWY